MASCSICKSEVETHRYLRAEPMKVEKDDKDRELLSPIQLKVCGFYCLRHKREDIAAAIMKEYPPSDGVPIRLLWSPAPQVVTLHQFSFDQAAALEGSSRDPMRCKRCGKSMTDEIHRKGFGIGVTERLSRDGWHGVRTAVVRDEGALTMMMDELLPPNTDWYIPHTGEVASVDQARDILTRLFGEDDEISEAIRDKIAKL